MSCSPLARTSIMSCLVILLLALGCAGPTESAGLYLPSPHLSAEPADPPSATAVHLAAPVEAPASPAPPAVPDAWQARRKQHPWRYIVIHHSATDTGSAESFDRGHRARGFDELGYHFVITNGQGQTDGRVEVGSRWLKQKWGAHCGNTPDNEYNEYGIGICLVGDFRHTRPSRAQLAALRKLVRYLCRTYRIGPERVIGHQEAPCAVTQCPGPALQRIVQTVLRADAQKALGELARQ